MAKHPFANVRDVAVASLKLDPKNPRLPERVRGKSSLLKFVWVAVAPVECLHSRERASR